MGIQSITQRPLYKHDCEDCIYLGSKNEKDFYFNEHRLKNDILLIVRFGNEKDAYFCMPMSETKLALESKLMEDNAIFAICYYKYLLYKKQ
jgi:hypothetical protein